MTEIIYKAHKSSSMIVMAKGKAYSIYDAFPTKAGATSAAKGYRTTAGRIHPNNRTLAIVADLGPDAGRLRYGVFLAKGWKL